jgi:hypothetical protein
MMGSEEGGGGWRQNSAGTSLLYPAGTSVGSEEQSGLLSLKKLREVKFRKIMKTGGTSNDRQSKLQIGGTCSKPSGDPREARTNS